MDEVRLIDANALKNKLIMNFSKKPEAQYIYQHLIDIVDDSPTIDISREVWNKSNELLEKRQTYLGVPIGEWRSATDQERKSVHDYVESISVDCPDKGKWENEPSGWCCSQCFSFTKKLHPYCPNCGAEMIAGDTHEYSN